MENVNILGVNISKMNIPQAAEYIHNLTQDGKFHYIFTPNSEIIYNAYKNPEFKEVINSADLRTADGIGVVYASKIVGDKIKERAAGYDISREILKTSNGNTLYLFGAAPGIAEKAKAAIEKEFENITVVGTHDGYFDEKENAKIIADINEKKPDFLFVCLGSPKQEKWIFDNRNTLCVKAALGLGGCLDVYADIVKRAPDIYIKLGLEWFYRLVCEPKRFFRMLALPKFILTVIKNKIFQKRKGV